MPITLNGSTGITASAFTDGTTSLPTRLGLITVIPTSVAVGSGSGSVGTNGAVTFSGASSVSLNNCFTSTSDNYLIVWDSVLASGVANLLFTLRVSGTNATGSNYNYLTSNKTGTSNPAATFSSQTSINIGLINETKPNVAYTNIFKPFLAEPTGVISRQTSTYSTAYSRLVEGYHTLSTSYDGFTMTIDASTISGTIRVYAYSNE